MTDDGRAADTESPTFYTWLMRQQGEPDPLGTVAKDVAREFWWPEDATTLRECEQHWRKYDMDRAGLPFLREAWHTWKAEIRVKP